MRGEVGKGVGVKGRGREGWEKGGGNYGTSWICTVKENNALKHMELRGVD
jgi:hypothetical protein